MKRIITTLILSATFFAANAQAVRTSAKTTKAPASAATTAEAIKVTTYNAKFSKRIDSDILGHDMGTPATTIEQKEFGGAVVYWKIDIQNFKAIKAKYRLDVKVMQVKDGQESISYKHDMFIPNKNGWQFMYAEFTEGTYNIYISDQDNPADVYSKVTFVVPAKAKPDYKHNSTLVVCTSVDDNWNAVGATANIKAGTCMNFLYKAKDKIPGTVMTWNVVKVNADGNEDYITHLMQGSGGKPFRYLATSEGVCVFNTPGKYRVYLFERDNYDTSIRRDESSNYSGMTEVTVY